MLKGDIDNKPSPAIAIDLDLLLKNKNDEEGTIIKKLYNKVKDKVIYKTNWISQEVYDYEFKQGAMKLLENIFYSDRIIYIIAFRPYNYYSHIENLLERYDVVYNKLKVINSVTELDIVLSPSNIYYFYYGDPARVPFRNKSKGRRVENYNDISL